MYLHRSQIVELNNSDSGDSPLINNADKSNVKTKVCSKSFLIRFN